MWLDKGDYEDAKTGQTRKMTYLYIELEVQKRVDLRADCTILPEGPILGGAGLLRIQDQGSSDETLGPDQVVDGQGMGGFAAVTEQLSAIGGSLAHELDAAQADGLLRLIKNQLNAEKPDSLMAGILKIMSLIAVQLDAEKSEGLVAKLLETMTDLNAISASIRNELDPSQEKVLLSKLHLTLDHINAITGELRTQMDPEVRTALLGKLQLALDTVNESLGTVNGMLNENRPTIQATLHNVQQTSETLNTGIAKAIADELDAENPKSLMGKVHAAVDRMGSSLEDLNEITETADEVITLNEGALNKILANFKETSDHLKAATKDLRRNPWRLLYRPNLVETRELDIFDAARAFAEAATRLDDATARLEGLMAARKGTIPADDPQLRIIRTELQETFDKFNDAEKALWKSLNIKP